MVASYQGHLKEQTREESPQAREFMTQSFVRVSPEEDIYKAMVKILKDRVSGAMVVDGTDRVVGMVTEKDFLRLATQGAYDGEPHGGPVSAYMSRDIISIGPEMGVQEVAEIFLKHPYRKLPVVENDRVLGVVRRHDVLFVIEDFYKRRMAFLNQR